MVYGCCVAEQKKEYGAAILADKIVLRRTCVTVGGLEDWFHNSPKGAFVRNQQAVDAEHALRERDRNIKAEAQERVDLVTEIMSNRYDANGKIKRTYLPADVKKQEDALYDLPIDQLRDRAKYVRDTRALQAASVEDVRLRVRAEDQQSNPQAYERFAKMPSELVFSPEIHPRKLDRELIL
jgi:hypothetical protein